ncbi:MAG TPA: PsbP-related protein, partial [Anaerolineae bacterium]|nr:PsbP-related protein [Anaerolineae bacterium]
KGILTVVLVVALFSVACSLCPLCGVLGLGDDPGVAKHWENEELSFDYPGDWRTLSEIWRQPADIGVADPGTATPWEKYLTSVRIEEQALPEGSTLEAVFEETDPQAERAISEGTTTVDGAVAYERIYEKFHGEPLRKIREVWLEKEGTIYIISCWSTPGHFEEAQSDFDLIVGSFHVK